VPVYLCRKDGTDLTAAVERAIVDEGPGVLDVDILVEGSPEESGASSDQETFLGAMPAGAPDDLIRVVVICPTDNEPNRFVVRRRDD
jgi:hypothetical protein